ncbi:hypothetical protein B7494_g3123 [Chlorociboria aeruginascens]|nr:hypothetical protein B7494_g3123 [Chlorociboria aeruginascens]
MGRREAEEQRSRGAEKQRSLILYSSPPAYSSCAAQSGAEKECLDAMMDLLSRGPLEARQIGRTRRIEERRGPVVSCRSRGGATLAAMDYAACNVVYIDRTAHQDRLVRREDGTKIGSSGDADGIPPRKNDVVDSNLQTLLGTFSEVYICTSGRSCMAKLSDLNRASIIDLIPTLVLVDIPYEDHLRVRRSRDIRTPSPNSRQGESIRDDEAESELYGLKLLQWIASEIQYQSLSRLVVPVAVVTMPEQTFPPRGRTSSKPEVPQLNDPFQPSSTKKSSARPLDQARTIRCLDVGAVDVLTSPLLRERLPSLAIHAYRAHKEASKEKNSLLEMKKGRKRSWVGLDDQKPYAYLREAMVSGLMDGICKLGGDDSPLGHKRISVAVNRQEMIASAIGSWHFSAHDFSDDELLHAALLMLQHALAMPELEQWRISTENLTGFLVASRSAYNAFVPYHNFRHVVDVLQAIFHFLVQLGRLPGYPRSSTSSSSSKHSLSPIAALIRPFDALTLLITAIGHDVGHPGVNNAFLVTLNAPLAQLYNDRSVLESFHCAAYSQILRRHWPAAFQGVEMRQLMISSILATDMGLHFGYMKKLGFLQDRLHENGGTDGWNGRLIEEERTLACSLLIKCADISNVARRYDVAAKWTMILTEEFARQASMEKDLGIPSALFAAPVTEIIELGKSQVGFMNMFAIPLFQGVTDVMPDMKYCVDELQTNKAAWEEKIASVQEGDYSPMMDDRMLSPRSMSLALPDGSPGPKSSSSSSPSPKSGSSSYSRIKDMLTRSPFTENGVISESPDHSPERSPSHPASSPRGSNASPTSPRRSSKPSQLQLTHTTASAPGLLDPPQDDAAQLLNGQQQTNGIHTQPSLVTDQVVIDPQTQDMKPPHEKQRGSDTTDGSISATGDWASQATSATTSKTPLSPSTQGTSIMSHDSIERTPAGQTPTCASPLASDHSQTSTATSTGNTSPHIQADNKEGIMETVRSLKKKPSRFRMNSLHFWKRSKSASPPMPTGRKEDAVSSSEDNEVWNASATNGL